MFTTRPELRGTFGVAASTHWIASQAAMRMLELGGNAFDAVVAGGLVLQVVQPHLNGPGGDLVVLAWDASAREAFTMCGQGPAPAAATIERMTALGHDLIPGTGLLPAVVPGAFDAWMKLLSDHGSLPLADVLAPALGYAWDGMPVSSRLSATISAAANMFRAYWPTSAAIYLPGNEVPAAGAILANRALAGTWERLLREAAGAGLSDRVAQIDATRRAWSQGFVADAVDRFFSAETVMDVSGRRNPGLLRGSDMAAWSAGREAPVFLERDGLRVAKAGPWTQGPVLLQSLAILAGDDIGQLDPEGADFVHLTVEAMKLAYADREAYYGDPAFVSVPLDTLLSPTYAAQRRHALSMTDASSTCRPGAVAGRETPALAAAHAAAYDAACARIAEAGLLGRYGGGEPTFANLDTPPQPFVGDTCTIEVADRFGNMVAATPSGGWLQSSPVVPDLGFPLGTRAQSMSLDPEAPSALAPGRRPRTTLTPTLVLDDDGARLAMGTPGGDQQDQWQLVFLLRHLDHGYDLQRASEAPAFHSEHWPNSFYPRHARRRRLVLGGRWSEAVREDLAGRGHDIKVGEAWTEGRIAAVGRDGPFLTAGASPRGMQNYAAGR